MSVTHHEPEQVGHVEQVGQRTGHRMTVTTDGEVDYFVVIGGTVYDACGRCDESLGVITWAGHVYGGVCFQCNGAGHRSAVGDEATAVKVATRRAKARIRAAVKREADLAAKRAATDAAVAAWREANPEVAALVDEVLAGRPAWDYAAYASSDEAAEYAWREQWGNFIVDLADGVDAVAHPGMTEAQGAAFVAAVAKVKAREQAKVERQAASRHLDAQEGDKVAVTGTVEVRLTVEQSAGYTTRTALMLVIKGTGEHEGVTVKTTGSGATLWDVQRGDTVTLSGTVKGFGEYDGVAQTLLTRCKATVVATAS